VNVINFILQSPDHCREAIHVVFRAGHVECAMLRVAEVHLRIDD
jgi:hypothetical protein